MFYERGIGYTACNKHYCKGIAHNRDEEGDNNLINKREDVTLKNKQQTLKSGLNGAHNE